MVSHPDEHRVILSDYYQVRIIGGHPVFTKYEKFREMLTLFWENNHVDGYVMAMRITRTRIMLRDRSPRYYLKEKSLSWKYLHYQKMAYRDSDVSYG